MNYINKSFLIITLLTISSMPLNIHGAADQEELNLNDQLLRAVKSGNVQLVKELIEQGADVNTKEERFGLGLLHYANNLDDSNDMIKELLAHGADINATDKFGNTPLMDAAQHNKADVVKLLLTYPLVNARAENIHGQTALSLVEGRRYTPGSYYEIQQMIEEYINKFTLTKRARCSRR